MGNTTVLESCDLIVPEVVEGQADQVYWESPVEYIYKYISENLLDAHAGTPVPLSELYANKSFSDYFRHAKRCSISFNQNPWFTEGRPFFSKSFLETLWHEQIHVAARIYYGEKPGPDSFVHGPGFRKIASKCGVNVSVEGIHTKIKEPFAAVVLKRFGITEQDTFFSRKPLLIAN